MQPGHFIGKQASASILRIMASCLLLLAAHAGAATFYVDAHAADDNGDGSAQRPKKYIGSGSALMPRGGGHTLIVRPGVYEGARNAVALVRAGAPDAWNIVKAETDGTVTITAPLELPQADHYLQFEGLKWESNTSKSIIGRYVKMIRCAFKDGPLTDNTVILGIGTNDATPGAQYILIEDSYVYGVGGRYNLLVYNSDKVVLRRVVARHQSGWKDTKGDPQGTISLYNSTDVLTQNLLIVDSGDPGGYFEAALYHPSNKRASRNIRNIGAIILNTTGTAVGWDDRVASSGNLLEDSVIWRAQSAIAINGAPHAGSLNRLTIGKITESGINDWKNGAGFSLTNSILWEVSTKSFKGVPHSNNVCHAPACRDEASMNPAASGLRWLPRVEADSPLGSAGAGRSRVGALVVKRLGVSGTLHGDPGFDRSTTEDLWPWPQDAAIRKAMCADAGVTTGFCARPSLTQYVWEQLGTPMPAALGLPR